jgi:serine/threonine-protein kinase HipA
MSGQLRAYINDTMVGTLRDVQGVWSFQYADGWLKNPHRFALSPHLPLQVEPLVDGASVRPVQWYFDNLLPEEGQRTLLAKDAKIDAADAIGLLAYYGAESAGSITLLTEESGGQGKGGLRELPDADLSARIRNLPNVPLTHAAVKRMSLAGAQHKLAVVLDTGALFEPYGAQPSTHILKPDHPGADYPHSAVNEWFIMLLAARSGIRVPAVYRRYVPEPVYIIERFDRLPGEAGWQRLHAIDACQLLGLDRSFKYAQGSVEALARLALMCRSSAVARTRLYQWLVFNVLVGNSDAHLKNLSFLISRDGVELAPHYDLLSVACYESRAFDQEGWPTQTILAWPILGTIRFAELNAQILLEAGQAMGLAAGTARRLFLSMRKQIFSEASKLYDEVAMQNAQLVAARAELASTLAGESRGLRTIVHTVISEMHTRTRID